MRVAVLGAGAVGCYFGGLLARAGHDVLFVGRRAHVEAINADGLLLDTTTFRDRVPARAATDVAAIDEPDLVLVCVKSGDTEDAGKALAGRLSAETIVLSLQNGVDNAERLAVLLGQNVEPAIVYAGVEMAGPGHVKHHGRGELVIGASEHSGELAAALRAAGVSKLSELVAMDDAALAKISKASGTGSAWKSGEWKVQAQEMIDGKPPRAQVDRDLARKMAEKSGK